MAATCSIYITSGLPSLAWRVAFACSSALYLHAVPTLSLLYPNLELCLTPPHLSAISSLLRRTHSSPLDSSLIPSILSSPCPVDWLVWLFGPCLCGWRRSVPVDVLVQLVSVVYEKHTHMHGMQLGIGTDSSICLVAWHAFGMKKAAWVVVVLFENCGMGLVGLKKKLHALHGVVVVVVWFGRAWRAWQLSLPSCHHYLAPPLPPPPPATSLHAW